MPRRRPPPLPNSIAVMRPEIVRLWHPHKNGTLTPGQVTWKAGVKLWWKCPNGPDHEWLSMTHSHTGRVTCPFCYGRRASAANNLFVLHPEVARSWHPSRNEGRTPRDVTPGSNLPAWWQCSRGHEWEEKIIKRVGSNKSCPTCWRMERQDHVWVREERRRLIPAKPLRTLASARPALARLWHPRKNVPLTPADVAPYTAREIWWRCLADARHEWRARPGPEDNRCPFCAGHQPSADNNLARLHPEIARTWHRLRNAPLKAREVLPGSHANAWWRCRTGHEWREPIAPRVARGDECLVCCALARGRGERLSPAQQALFHPVYNGSLTAELASPRALVWVWWRCTRDVSHEWRARLSRATPTCPLCEPRLSGPSLADAAPAAAKLWHPTKNGALSPAQVTVASSRSVWWKCPRGSDHEWQGMVRVWSQARNPCPFCRGRRIAADNTLAARYPSLAAEWHPTKNGRLKPTDILPGASLRAWWRCRDHPKHVWQARVSSRRSLHATRGKTGCPFCTHRAVAPESSVASVFPALVPQWHPSKNGQLTPKNVSAKSARLVWWRCPAGPDHEWEMAPCQRVAHEKISRCPFCANWRLSVTNSIAALAPHLVPEWHPTMNGAITPDQVIGTTQNAKYWWSCPRGHVHDAMPYTRVVLKRGCRYCPARERTVATKAQKSHRLMDWLSPRRS